MGARPYRDHHDRLSIEEIEALTTRDFFDCILVDAENGTAVMQRDDESQLVQYLTFHGLRLPRAVKAAQVLDLCNDLRWSFGEAVRCAVRGERDIGVAFPLLNAEKLAYVRAMGRQEPDAVRDMARVVFKAPAYGVFLF
ncbi:hypothetical protein [Hydrogenophaga sp.]|uniref:hypothetical protein n=1 Tax=Hydrogenophaga sp. TaxID=1904254 RepID=UPI003D0B0DBB